jgi:hypothetical protein
MLWGIELCYGVLQDEFVNQIIIFTLLSLVINIKITKDFNPCD